MTTRLAGHPHRMERVTHVSTTEEGQERIDKAIGDLATIRDRELSLDNREWNRVEYEISRIKERRDRDKILVNRLKKLDRKDPHENGTILTWWDSTEYQQTAMKSQGRWVITGAVVSMPWEDLVVGHLMYASCGHIIEFQHLEDGTYLRADVTLDSVADNGEKKEKVTT